MNNPAYAILSILLLLHHSWVTPKFKENGQSTTAAPQQCKLLQQVLSTERP